MRFIVKLVDHVICEATMEMFSNQNPRLDPTMEGQQSNIHSHNLHPTAPDQQ